MTEFEHFARDLFLDIDNIFFEISSSDRAKVIRQPICTELFHHASFALDLFVDAHCDFFIRSFVKSHKQVLKTDEQFFKFAIPRCLNLIDNDRYFYSIMLVACFLKECLLFLSESRKCYRFHFIAYKCLAAVFERSFKNYFESNGGWNGFGKYLLHVIGAKSASKEGCILSVLNEGNILRLKKVEGLIKHCDDISDDFNLNEYEMSLLMDDDIKYIEESLYYDEADEDPLNLTWPPDDKVMNEKLKMASFLVESSDDLNGKRGMDESEEDNYLDCKASILFHYMNMIETEAEMRLGTEKFMERMKLRPCPCCGIKCYQFAMKLISKQIDLAITNKALANALEKKSQIKAKL